MIFLIADDWTAAGFNEYEAEQIVERDLTVVCAPRPLRHFWSKFETGYTTYHKNLWHVAAGDPEGSDTMYGTLARSWEADNAEVVHLITIEEAEQIVRDLWNKEDQDNFSNVYQEMFGDNWPITVMHENRIPAVDGRLDK